MEFLCKNNCYIGLYSWLWLLLLYFTVCVDDYFHIGMSTHIADSQQAKYRCFESWDAYFHSGMPIFIVTIFGDAYMFT